MLWGCANILFFTTLSPTNFSIYWWFFLPARIMTGVFAKWDFSCPSLPLCELGFYCKEKLYILPPLIYLFNFFISAWTYRHSFCCTDNNRLLPLLIVLLSSPQIWPYKRTPVSSGFASLFLEHLLPSSHHETGCSSSGTLQAPALALAFFFKELLFFSLENAV